MTLIDCFGIESFVVEKRSLVIPVWLVRKWAIRDRNLIWCFVFYVVLEVGF